MSVLPPSFDRPWLRKISYASRADVKFLFQETHIKRVYEQCGVSLGSSLNAPVEARTVLDVGANIGMFATRAAEAIGSNVRHGVMLPYGTCFHTKVLLIPKKTLNHRRRSYPQGHVIAVEPLPETFAALQSNLNIHEEWCLENRRACASVTPVNAGVGNGTTATARFTLFPRAAGWATLSEYENKEEVLRDMEIFIENSLKAETEGGNGIPWPARQIGLAIRYLSKPAFRAVVRLVVGYLMSDRREVTCPMTTVSQLIDEFNVQHITLLKVDVERAEFDVLMGIRQQHWDIIDQVAIECHQENLGPLKRLLKSHGFSSVNQVQTGDLEGTGIFMIYGVKQPGQ